MMEWASNEHDLDYLEAEDDEDEDEEDEEDEEEEEGEGGADEEEVVVLHPTLQPEGEEEEKPDK